MEHLTYDALARLVNEPPSSSERQHLQNCSQCAEEFRALRRQSDALGGLAALRPPSGDWESLEARLVSEGLIRTPETFRRFGFAAAPAWMQAAAAVVVFFGGPGSVSHSQEGRQGLGFLPRVRSFPYRRSPRPRKRSGRWSPRSKRTCRRSCVTVS